MNFVMFWKVFGDCCLYFSVVGALPELFTHHFSFLWPALLCGLGASLAARLGGGKRILGFLPLMLALLRAGTAVELMLLLPPLIYTAIVILRGDFSLDYLHTRENFHKCAVCCAAFLVLLVLGLGIEKISRPLNVSLDLGQPSLFMGFYGISGVLLLRRLRLGPEADKNLDTRQTVIMLLGVGAILLAFAGVEALMADIVLLLGKVLRFLFSLPLTIIVMVLSPMIDELKAVYQEPTIYPTTEPPSTQTLPDMTGEGTSLPQSTPVSDSGYPWWLAVLILSALLILLLTALKLYRSRTSSGSAGTVFDKVSPARRKAREPRVSNRVKVRRLYREHLRNEKRKGLRLRPDQTSEDILNSIAPDTDAEAAARLRRVYLKARYGENRPITAEDVAEARAALKQTRSK